MTAQVQREIMTEKNRDSEEEKKEDDERGNRNELNAAAKRRHCDLSDQYPQNDASTHPHDGGVTHEGNHDEDSEEKPQRKTGRRPKRGPRGGVVRPFPVKLYQMLEDSERGFSDVVGWQPHGRAFIVLNHRKFVDGVMRRYFQQTKMTSFQRQLNLYGFTRIQKGRDAGGYYHKFFLRGRPDLCQHMLRTKIKGTGHKYYARDDTEPDFYALKPLPSEGRNGQAKNYPTDVLEGDDSEVNERHAEQAAIEASQVACAPRAGPESVPDSIKSLHNPVRISPDVIEDMIFPEPIKMAHHPVRRITPVFSIPITPDLPSLLFSSDMRVGAPPFAPDLTKLPPREISSYEQSEERLYKRPELPWSSNTIQVPESVTSEASPPLQENIKQIPQWNIIPPLPLPEECHSDSKARDVFEESHPHPYRKFARAVSDFATSRPALSPAPGKDEAHSDIFEESYPRFHRKFERAFSDLATSKAALPPTPDKVESGSASPDSLWFDHLACDFDDALNEIDTIVDDIGFGNMLDRWLK